MRTTMEAAIFDLDGTLLDSTGMWSRLDLEFLKSRGLPADPGYERAINGMSYREAARYTIGHYGLTETPEALISDWNRMAAAQYRDHIALKPGAAAFLQRLRARGVPLGVATASPEALYRPALERTGIYRYFSAFATVAEVPRGKEFPDVYLLAAERLGAQPGRCVVFEDVLAGVRGAKAAGMTVVAVRDPSSAHLEREIRELADRFISGFTELLNERETVCYTAGNLSVPQQPERREPT